MTQATTIIKASRANPAFFLREVLGTEYITPQQMDVCRSVQANRRTAVPAGHGVGKTHLAARLALWFLFTYPHSKVLTTAPTWQQVENLLWREIRKAHQQAKYALGGQVQQTEINIDEDWFAVGLSTNDATRFQGHHAPRIMIIFDEATGVAPEIWEAAEGVAIGPDDRFLAIGNPTDPMSQFKKVCDSKLWNVIPLNAEEHPNVTEGRIFVPGAVTKEWIDERLIEYGGKDTALYRARVLGKFPEQGDDMLISLADVERAQERWEKPSGRAKSLGVDVARFGSDETIEIEIFENGVVGAPRSIRGQNLMATAGSVKVNTAEKKAVDDSGLGGGVTDRLIEQKVDVIPYIAGGKAFDSDRFLNRRAETWWMIREALKKGEMSLPPDNMLAADLTNIKYAYTSKGQIKLESKDDIKKRLGRSPDRGDALAIALAAIYEPVFEVSDRERQAFAALSL